ncbi:hypothetical protein Hanom_Chr04g00337581 [Helianthus anomalus]
MKKLQQQRAIVRANREADAQIREVASRPPWEEEFNKQLANFHMLATTAVDANQTQVAEPPLLPLFPDQQMLEPNPENQLPIPAFDSNELPRIPTPQPLQYDPWFDDNRSYSTLYPLEELKHLEPDPWKDIDRTFFEMNSADPYEEPVPPPEPLDPLMSRKQVQELH